MTHASTSTLYPLLGERLSLEIKPKERLALLHFNDPSARNAISAEAASALSELVTQCQSQSPSHPFAQLIHNGTLLVLILRSHVSGTFLAGGDLKAIANFTPEEGQKFTDDMRSFTQFLREGPLVSVAALTGVAAGGGSEIALACDLRVALEANLRIDLAQSRWGVPAGWGMMNDLRARGIYGSERRRGIAVASHESWNISHLSCFGLLDARFDNSPNPEFSFQTWLEDFIVRLADCPDSLRRALIIDRPKQSDSHLEDFDRALFGRFWLGEVHLQRVAAYIQKRLAKNRESTQS
jgi:hypothetical protein